MRTRSIPASTPQAIRIPITRLALETTGTVITANTVALGVLVGLTGVVSREAIEKAVTARAPRGTEEMNRKALAGRFRRRKTSRPKLPPRPELPGPDQGVLSPLLPCREPRSYATILS